MTSVTTPPAGVEAAGGAPDTSSQRRKQRRAFPRPVLGVIGVAGALAAWELLSRTEVLPSKYFPPASDVLAAFALQWTQPGFLQPLLLTLQGWFLGLAAATAIALVLGILCGSSRLLYDFFRLTIELLRPIPPVVLIPLAILLFGVNQQLKIFLVAFGALWPLLVQTIAGAKALDKVTSEMTRSYGLKPSQVFGIRLMSASPYIATGMRISATVALIVTIVAEMVGGAPGLGRDILQAQANNNQTLMYALVLVAGVLGVAVNFIFQRAEAKVLFWHASQRSKGD